MACPITRCQSTPNNSNNNIKTTQPFVDTFVIKGDKMACINS